MKPWKTSKRRRTASCSSRANARATGCTTGRSSSTYGLPEIMPTFAHSRSDSARAASSSSVSSICAHPPRISARSTSACSSCERQSACCSMLPSTVRQTSFSCCARIGLRGTSCQHCSSLRSNAPAPRFSSRLEPSGGSWATICSNRLRCIASIVLSCQPPIKVSSCLNMSVPPENQYGCSLTGSSGQENGTRVAMGAIYLRLSSENPAQSTRTIQPNGSSTSPNWMPVSVS